MQEKRMLSKDDALERSANAFAFFKQLQRLEPPPLFALTTAIELAARITLKIDEAEVRRKLRLVDGLLIASIQIMEDDGGPGAKRAKKQIAVLLEGMIRLLDPHYFG